MFIGIDVGNTSTMLGIYKSDSVLPEKFFRYRTVKNADFSALGSEIDFCLQEFPEFKKEDISGFAFSSVVPEINSTYHETAEVLYNVKALEIGHGSRFSIKIDYKDIRQLGIDRIVDAEAVFNEYGPGAIVIDIGTAATYDVLDRDGVFRGGLIGPGIGITIKALASAASNLPEIVFEEPDMLIAKDTVNAVKSGFYYGWISMIDGIIERIQDFCGGGYRVILTGGFAESITGSLKADAVYDPVLTMKGIKYIFDLNRDS
jgi:type III pantothenate kinase